MASPCIHHCACGAQLICASDMDRCAVGEHWTCPTCEQDAVDDYFRQAEFAQPIPHTTFDLDQQRTQLETTR